MKKFIVIFIIFLLPNLFWQVVASFLDVYRVIFNLDYLFIISFWVLSKKRIGFFLFFVVNFFDFLNIFSQIFPFIRLLDLIYLIKFAVYANPINILAFILFLALSFFYIKFSAQKLDNSYQLSLVLCINFFLLFWFVQNFLVGDDSRLWSMQSNRVIASQILNTYNVRTEGFVQSLSDKGEVFQNNQIPSASNDIFKSPEQYKKMILIVNESWGIAKNDQFQKDLLAELIGNNQIQWLWRKPLNVDGFTINGEIRELCQKSLQGFNLKDQQTGFQNCLPNILKAKGYYTVAMHGATGAMYDRKYWYPKVGFDQQIFRESLPDLNSRCYSFPGFCDRDLQNQIVDQFGKHKKIFFYWLT